jgi:hypothetical protein
LPGYEKWIEGEYCQNLELRKAMTDKKRDIWDVLREGYPNALSPRDLKEWKSEDRKKIKENTAQTYPQELVKDKVISCTKRELDKDSHIEVTKYYFEDYNYVSNQKNDFSYPFAPGYVQYTKNFLNTYDKITNKAAEDEIYGLLTDFLMDVMRKRKRANRNDLLCKNCGYNHETRDFIRAALLHLIDGLDTNRRFIEFMRSEGIIDDKPYKELMAMSRERQFSPSNRNEDQETERIAERTDKFKKMFKFILDLKAGITADQLLDMFNEKRKIIEDRKEEVQPGYLTDHGTLYLVGKEDLRISGKHLETLVDLLLK